MKHRLSIRWSAALAMTVALATGVLEAQQTVFTVGNTVYRSQEHSFRLRQLADRLANPWGFAFLPDGAVLITGRTGRLWILTRIDGTGRLIDVGNVPEVVAAGQGGLLDVALDPDHARNGLIYLAYVVRTESGSATRLSAARLERSSGSAGESARLEQLRPLFTMNRGGRTNQHFGARVVVGPDGNLYLSLGDRGEQQRAQDRDDHAGTVIRIGRDGSIPADNPFGTAVFTYGHRNGQGLAVHPQSGAIWMHEHGPRGGDEINILRAGANYGWPIATHGVAYSGAVIAESPSAPGTEPPLLHWTPSIAPSGMSFYRGAAFPGWEGNLFVGALAGQHLRRVVLAGERVVRQEELLSGFGRIRDVRSGPDGYLYFITDGNAAGLYRLEPAEVRS